MAANRVRQLPAGNRTLLLCLCLAIAFSLAPAAAHAIPLERAVILVDYDSPLSDLPIYSATGRIPAGVPLPATIILPVPDGAVIRSTGQVFDDGRDELAAEYEEATIDGGRAVTFQLTESRVGNITAVYQPALSWVDAETGITRFQLDLQMPVDAGDVYAALLVPQSVEVVSFSEGVSSEPMEEGSTSYFREFRSTGPGERLGLWVDLRSIARGEGGEPASPAIVAFVVLALVGSVVFLTLGKRRRSGRAAD